MTILEGHGRVASATLASRMAGVTIAPKDGGGTKLVRDGRAAWRQDDAGAPGWVAPGKRADGQWSNRIQWFGRRYVATHGREATEAELADYMVRETETRPYAIVVRGKLCGMFARGEEAQRRALHMGPHAEVWYCAWVSRPDHNVDYTFDYTVKVKGRHGRGALGFNSAKAGGRAVNVRRGRDARTGSIGGPVRWSCRLAWSNAKGWHK